MHVLVTGATGLLGGRLVDALRAAGHTVVCHGRVCRSDVNADLQDPRETKNLLESVGPDALVNLAAMTGVDACEKHPEAAWRMNCCIPSHLAAYIAAHPATRFVHLSTDHVYGAAPGPHDEESVCPVNAYAWSKLCGEQSALRAEAVVLRTNFFGPGRHPERLSFSDWVLRQLKNREEIRLVTDVLFSPLRMETVCRMIGVVLDRFLPGVYNLGSKNGLSKRDFAHRLAGVAGADISVAEDVGVDQLGLLAPRPRDMRMDSSRFEAAYGVSLPDLVDEIHAVGD